MDTLEIFGLLTLLVVVFKLGYTLSKDIHHNDVNQKK